MLKYNTIEIKNITFNGTEIEKVIFNRVIVFEKETNTIAIIGRKQP